MAAILVPRGSVHSAPALGTPTLRAVEVGRPAGASNPTKPRVWRSLAPTLLAAGCSRRWVRRRAAAEGAAAAGLSDEETQRIEAFHQTMSYNGLGVVQLPSEVIEHLRAGAVKTLAGEGPAEGFQRAKPSGGGFPPRMEWHWASDGSARETFGPAVDVLLKYLPNFQLLAAKFIVATGECSAEDAKFHQDFSPPTVPLLATATALAPVWPLAFPEKEGNLEFFTWDDMIKSKQQGSPDEVMKLINVHRYSPGEVAIFDSKLFHRTQPFSEHAFASSSLHGESEVLSKRRILASFYFAQLPEGNTWGGIVRGVLTSQGAPELG